MFTFPIRQQVMHNHNVHNLCNFPGIHMRSGQCMRTMSTMGQDMAAGDTQVQSLNNISRAFKRNFTRQCAHNDIRAFFCVVVKFSSTLAQISAKVQWNENTVKFLHTNIRIDSSKFNDLNETKVKVKLTKQLKLCKIFLSWKNIILTLK